MDMAREVAAAYYRAMPADRLGYDITRLRDFLVYDHFHLDVVPAEHIRHLRITVSPVECARLSMVINETICISEAGQQIVNMRLKELDLIRHKVGFRLTVVLGFGIWGAWTEQTMEAFRGTYEALKAEGMEFRIYGQSSKAHYPVLRIDGYFKMSREQWYKFVSGQARDEGDFDAEHSDDEDGSERVARYGTTLDGKDLEAE